MQLPECNQKALSDQYANQLQVQLETLKLAIDHPVNESTQKGCTLSSNRIL